MDDDAPLVTLVLSPTSIAESGASTVSTVTARLSAVASAATTVTVAATAVSPAVAGDFTLNGTPLTIAAGATTSTGTVTVTAVDNATDAPDKSVTVSGTVAGGDGAADPADATLTLTDDDAAPTVALALSSTSMTEVGGVSTVSATLSHPSSAVTTVTVTPVSTVYTVGAGADATIVIAAGATTAADVATVTAVDDTVHQGSGGRPTTVTGSAANTQGVGSVTGAALLLTDNENLPLVALVLSPTSIDETGAGNVSTVTATLSGESSEAVAVTVSSAAVSPAIAGDYTQSGTLLTIAVGATTSTGTVTLTAVDNAVDAPDKSVTVSATAAGGHGVVGPPDATLTIEDDEALPEVALVLSEPDPTKADTINESGAGNVSTVTATLSGESSEAVTLTVSAAGVPPAGEDDFRLSTVRLLTIAAGATTSTGTVTVTARDNAVDAPDKSVTISATASGGNTVANPSDATLTIEDDEALPTVALALSPASIDESGASNVSTVTATLSGESSEAVTVTVAATAVAPAGADDFRLSTVGC